MGQGASPDSTNNNIEEITAEAAVPTVKPLFPGDRPVYKWVQTKKKQLSEKYGLDIALQDTTIYQATSGGIEHNQSVENTLSLFSMWKFIRDPNKIDGAAIAFQFETRNNPMSDTFPEMQRDLGTLWSPNDATSDNYGQIKQLWGAVRFGEGKFTLQAGKIDPTAYINKNRFAASGNSQYFSQPLATNPARAFSPNGIGAVARFVPSDLFYVQSVISDGDADSDYSPFKTIDGNWLYATELVLTPKCPKLGEGNYRFMVWQRNTDAEIAQGLSFSFDQNLGKNLGVFLRYGMQNGDLSQVDQIAAAGVSFLDPFDRINDQAGIGISWTRPADSDLRDEYAAEVYYRLQLTEGIELSVGAQLILNPSDSTNDAVGVYETRLRLLY